MSTDAIDTPTTADLKRQIPSRRARRDYYRMARSQAKRIGKPLAPWGQTPLCVPNPRPGQVVDHIDSNSKPVMRACVFGGHFDGVPAQVEAAKRGNRYR